MEKYKLIHTKTKKETICNFITIDGFDYYYVINSMTNSLNFEPYYYIYKNILSERTFSPHLNDKKVIATNNPNINIPKIVNGVEKLAKNECVCQSNNCVHFNLFIRGYNKAKETYQYSKEDMIDLIQSLKDYTHESHTILGHDERDAEELIDIWQENKIITLYYE
jgi:hypothetical protein